jgi:membrane protein implicated in regulation of membrane protease activity
MESSTIWWLVGAFFFSLELLSGSLYLLLLSLGAVAAAIGATLGMSHQEQMAIATVVGGGLVMLWHLRLLRRGVIDIEGRNTTGLGDLDVGEQVSVLRWNTDGTARVRYRGDQWHAMHHGPHVPQAGVHRILSVEDTHLVLEPVRF